MSGRDGGRLPGPQARTSADAARCAEAARFGRIDAAFRDGDLDALLGALQDPEAMPDGWLGPAIGYGLEYAVYHSPLPFIGTLLDLGANPNPAEHSGFPPLIAALTCLRSQPGAPARPDALEVVRLLLQRGAHPDQRGINDWTALHVAVVARSEAAVRLLLQHGADPRLRTRIDEYETAAEAAVASGLTEIARLLEAAQATSPGPAPGAPS